MAITKVGLRRFNKSKGNNPTGTKVYLVGSDTSIADSQVDTILDATLGSNAIPAHDTLWSAGDSVNLRVDNKRAISHDEVDGYQEGFWWEVTVNYKVPPGPTNQNPEDPRDRAWLWSKSTEKGERVMVNSLFNTTQDTSGGYVYPGADATDMVNLEYGDAICNTAGEPPQGGVSGPVSRSVFTISKYVDDASDLGVSSWVELDRYIDTINDGSITLLDTNYEKWELYMEDINYRPVNENGYDVVFVELTIVADLFKKHVFTFPSAGYNELRDGTDGFDLYRIQNEDGDVVSPQLLSIDGTAIPNETSAPFIKTPVLISVGRNEPVDWSVLTLPTSIP